MVRYPIHSLTTNDVLKSTSNLLPVGTYEFLVTHMHQNASVIMPLPKKQSRSAFQLSSRAKLLKQDSEILVSQVCPDCTHSDTSALCTASLWHWPNKRAGVLCPQWQDDRSCSMLMPKTVYSLQSRQRPELRGCPEKKQHVDYCHGMITIPGHALPMVPAIV